MRLHLVRPLFACSTALLAVVTIMVACTTVDPSECWPNTSGGFGGAGTIPIGAGVGVSSGDFASPRWGPLGFGAPPNPCVTMGGDTNQPAPSPPPPPMPSSPLDGLDPTTLALADLKASALAYYLGGLIESSGVDAGDPASLDALMAQEMPMAEAAVNGWLATIDPSTVPLAGFKWECKYSPYDCPAWRTCENDPYKSQNLTCWVTNCGVGKCGLCPNWFPDWAKTLLYKSWCAYVCIPGSDLGKVGALGVVLMTHWGPNPPDAARCYSPL
jgi:hypothetical protein